jgi:WD40 repeat protein/tRNA A-37 threonylcarbamoyl transferase component Bud32
MSENQRSTATDEHFQKVLAAILLAEESGKKPDLSHICRAHPDLAARLRQYFRDRDGFDRVAHRLAPPPRAADTPTPPELGPGASFAGYDIVKELGRGGMGAVYLARQRSTKRHVALKVIRADRLAHMTARQRADWLNRFRKEGQAAARVCDDHVVTVYEVGEADGRPFYSMRYVLGQSLADTIASGPVPNRRAAVLMEQVARAVQAIHDQGVLHRDLKPQNILVDAGGRAYVSDFGLAKSLADAETLTETGDMLGSPQYMSPEQSHDAAHVTKATDVYGLGATLYALLTGRPPFEGKTVAQTLHDVRYREPVPPRRLNPKVARDLDTLTLKCLEKEPGRRLGSACELADELQRYLDKRPIRTRPLGPAGRAWRWCRRNRVVSAVSAAAAVLLLAAATVVAVTTAARSGADAREKIAQNARQAAEQDKREAEGKLPALEQAADTAEYPDDMKQAGEAWYARNYARVHELLKKHDRKPGRKDHRGWEWHFLKAHTPSLEAGGKRAAVPRTLMADAPRGPVAAPQESQAPPLLTWLHGEPRVSILNPDGEFFVWHADTQARAQFTLHPPTEAVVVEDAVWAPDGRRVVSRSPDGTHNIWDAVTGQRLLPLPGHTGSRIPMVPNVDEGRLAWNAGGGLLAALSQDNQVTIWDTKTGAKVFTEGAPPRNPDWAHNFAAENRSKPTWSPDGKRLAYWRFRFLGSQGPPELALVDGTTGKAVKVPSKTFESLTPPPQGIIGGGVTSLPAPPLWRPDGKYLACYLEPRFPFGTGLAPRDAAEAMRQRADAKFGGTIVVVDARTGQGVYHAQGILPWWSPDGKYLIFQRAGGDRVLEFETRKVMRHPAGRVLAWSRDGKRMALFTGEVSSQMKMGWTPQPGERELLLRGGELRIIDVAAGTPLHVLKLGDPRRPKPRAKQGRGAGLVGGPPGAGQIRMPPLQGIPGAPGGPGGLVVPPPVFVQNTSANVWVVGRWSPDLKWVALEKGEASVRHDPLTGEEELMPRMPSSPPLGMPPAVNNQKPKRGNQGNMPPGLPGPPGATASVAHVHDLAGKKEPLRLPTLWLSWSPDGRRVVLDNGDVWDVVDRRKVVNVAALAYTYFLPGGITSSETKTFSWSPDGKWLLVGSTSSKANEATPGWQVYDTSTWKVAGSLPRNALVRWSPDSRRVLAGGRVAEPPTGEFFLFTIPSGEQKKLGAVPEAADVVVAAWSPDDRSIATGSSLGAVRVWDAGTGVPRLRFGCPHRVVALAWSADGRLFAADAEGVVKAWDVATQKEVVSWTVDAPKSPFPVGRPALKLEFSPRASRLALEGPEAVQVWDAATGKLLSRLGAAGSILAWRPDENALVLRENRNGMDGLDPKTIFENPQAVRDHRPITRAWDVRRGREVATFYRPVDAVTPIAAAWNPDGRRLAFCTGTEIKVHDAVSGKEVLTLRQAAGLVAWSRDGRRLAAQFAVKRMEWVGARPTVILWDATPDGEEPGPQNADPRK